MDAAHTGGDGGKGPSHADAGADAATSGHPDGSLASSSSGAAGQSLFTIPLTTTSDSFVYEAELTIGDQTFAMDIDTGSTTIAVAAATCASCTGITPKYTPTTGVDQLTPATSQYQDGSGWSGEIYRDTVTLAHGTPSVSLNFSTITSQTQFFEDNAYQGILGLGSVFNADTDTDAYLAMVEAKGVAPVTSFELCDTSGTMWLGGYDAAAANGAPTYTPMLAINDNNPFYSLDVDDLKLGGTSLGYQTSSDFQEPIVDTGTSLFYLPTGIFKTMLDTIKASSGFEALFPGQALTSEGCVQTPGVTDAMLDAQLPAMTIDFPSTTSGAPNVTLTATASQSYFYDNGNGQFCLAIGNGGTSDASTLGLTFLRAFVTIIDTGNGRIGFAPDLGCAAGGGMRVVHPRAWPPRPRPPRGRR
jgi:hypothetical protein